MVYKRKATFDQLIAAEKAGKFFLFGCYIYSYENSQGVQFDIGFSLLSPEDRALIFDDVFWSDRDKSRNRVNEDDDGVF